MTKIKKGSYLIICATREQADKAKERLVSKRYGPMTHAINNNSACGMSHLVWWKDSLHSPHDSPLRKHFHRSWVVETDEELEEAIMEVHKYRKEMHHQALLNFRFLKMKYPMIKFVLHRKYGDVWARYDTMQSRHKGTASSNSPVNLYEPDYARLDKEVRQYGIYLWLMETYKNLYFFVRTNQPKDEDYISVWTRRYHNDLPRDGTSTNFSFLYPIGSARDWNMLEELDYQVEKSREDNHFFCTKCHKTYSKDDYGFFYFAGTFCNKCKEENPDLYDRAQKETYN